MGYNRSLSAVYSDVWERYKHHCEHEGMIALNRFCEGEGINVKYAKIFEEIFGIPAIVWLTYQNHDELTK